MSGDTESEEMEASRLISSSFDRDLTPAELERLNKLLTEKPKLRMIKQTMEIVRQLMHSPDSSDENRVGARQSLPKDARSRIQKVLDQATRISE